MRLRNLIIGLLVLLSAIPALGYEMFPCNVGNKWEYETVKVFSGEVKINNLPVSLMKNIQSGRSIYEITEGPTNGFFSYLETQELSDIRGVTESEKTLIKISLTDKGMLIHSTLREATGMQNPESETYSPPLLYFASDADKNKTWDIGAFKDKDLSEPFKGRSAGRETVTVPAGTFKDCLKVVYSSEGATGTFDAFETKFKPAGGKSINVYWIAEGVGVVKELEVSTSKAEAKGPDGSILYTEGSTCTVSELKPGYVVKK